MILLDIAIVGCVLSLLIATLRIGRGPTPADRVVAADLLTFSFVGLIALIGTRFARQGTFDLVVIATLVTFLSAIALARALARGER